MCFPEHKQSSPLRNIIVLFLFPPPASGSLQATRALMIVGIIVSISGLGVACMGMKCTTCGGSDRLRKSRVAMTGGIILLVGGEEEEKLLMRRNWCSVFGKC